jgi:hypothetical protein
MKVARSVTDGIFRHQLGGFPNYPLKRDARFLEVFNEVCISVEHAQSVILAFEVKLPTLQDIRDCAANLRPRFEDLPNPEKEWAAQYGAPNPNWSKNLVGNWGQQRQRVLWQAIRDAIYYTEGPGQADIERLQDAKARKADREFWTRIALDLRKFHPVELEEFRQTELPRGWQDLRREDWAGEVSNPQRITKARRAEIAAQFEDVKALAAGESPDRWE